MTQKQVKCSKCNSLRVTCSHEYFPTGADMESVEWKHTCSDCGHIDSDIQQSCSGYDNDYTCPFPNCSNTFRP